MHLPESSQRRNIARTKIKTNVINTGITFIFLLIIVHGEGGKNGNRTGAISWHMCAQPVYRQHNIDFSRPKETSRPDGKHEYNQE